MGRWSCLLSPAEADEDLVLASASSHCCKKLKWRFTNVKFIYKAALYMDDICVSKD